MRKKKHSWTTTFYYKQEVDVDQMMFTIIAQGVPVGNTVAISSIESANSNGSPIPPIKMNPTSINNEKSFSAGIYSDVPVGYEGNISFTLSGGKKSFPEGSHVSLQVSYLDSSGGSGPSKLILVKNVTTTNE